MPDRQRSIATAARQIQARDYRKAEAVLAPLCEPGQPVDDAVQLLALVRTRLGDGASADRLFRRYLEHTPNNPAVWNNYGNLVRKRDPASAVPHFQAALRLQPEYPDALYSLALCLYYLGDHSAALGCLDRLAAIADQAREKQLRGVLELELHRPGRARDSFRAYLARKPGDSSGLLNLAIALRRLGERDEALAVLASAGPVLPPKLARERCALLHETGRWQEAEQALEALIASSPGDLEAHDMLDKIRYQAGDHERVGASLRSAYAASGDPRLLGQLALIEEKLGRAEQAAELLARIPDQLAENPDLARQQARLALSARGPEAAAALFAAAQVRFPDHRDLLLDHCRLLVGAGELAAAAERVTHCLRLHPQDQEAWSYQGTLWKLAGDERYHWLCDYERFVGEQQLLGEGLDADYLAELCAYLEGLHDASHAPMDQTLRGGTQTPGALFNRPSPLIEKLVERLRVLVGRHVASLPSDPRHPLLSRRSERVVFNGSWSVRLASQGRHINHNHRDGWFSSALYIDLPPGIGGDKREGCLQLGQSNFGLGAERDPVERVITPEVGKLALFPSYVWHGTVPFSADAQRITVAFDSIPDPASC